MIKNYKKQQKHLGIWLLIKLLNKIPRVLKKSETVTNDHGKEMPKKRFISPEERQKIIDDLRLI